MALYDLYDTVFLVMVCGGFGALVVTLAAVSWYCRSRRGSEQP